MQAINKYIIVNEIKEEKKTESGLLLTVDDQAEFRYKLGEVVNPGTNVEVIKAGDKFANTLQKMLAYPVHDKTIRGQQFQGI